jgi:phasin family protein
MTTQPGDFLMQAWKQQLDGWLRAVETLVDAANKLSQLQIEAAVGAHADLEATRNAMTTAGDPARVVELQTQCARANAEKCAAYWRRFYEVGADGHRAGLQAVAGYGAADVPVAGNGHPGAGQGRGEDRRRRQVAAPRTCRRHPDRTPTFR